MRCFDVILLLFVVMLDITMLFSSNVNLYHQIQGAVIDSILLNLLLMWVSVHSILFHIDSGPTLKIYYLLILFYVRISCISSWYYVYLVHLFFLGFSCVLGRGTFVGIFISHFHDFFQCSVVATANKYGVICSL